MARRRAHIPEFRSKEEAVKLAYINDLEFSGLFMLGLSWEHDVSVNLAVKLSVELEERRSFILQSTLSSFLTAVPSIMKDFQGPRFPKCYVKLSLPKPDSPLFVDEDSRSSRRRERVC